MGKIYEKILLARLFFHTPENSLIHPQQFGFRKGKSTINALFHIFNTYKSAANSKYVCAIFLDIEKAFDAAWWRKIFLELSLLDIPPNLLTALRNFLADRRVILTQGGLDHQKVLSRGCPQGSVLSPILWNILVNSLLKLPLPTNYSITAYADDITLLISANSRSQIETAANHCLTNFSAWASECKLRFSAKKTKGLLLRGVLKRPPLIKLDGTSIQFVKEFKYLGFWLSKDFNFVPHVTNTCQAISKLLPSMANFTKAFRHYQWKNSLLIYKQAILPKLTYGVALWGLDLPKVAVIKRITALQRSFLIRMTRAFPTSPGAPLDLITNIDPIALHLNKIHALEYPKFSFSCRSFGRATVNFNGLYSISLNGSSITCNKKGASRILTDELHISWNNQWTNNTHHWTGRFFPDLFSRREALWFTPSPSVTQFITGHCNVRAYLHRFNLLDDDTCDCGAIQDPEHELVCPDLVHIRPTTLIADPRALVSNDSTFQDFKSFLHKRYVARLNI